MDNSINKKKKIAYIDHSFHEKTKSTCFFKDILKEKYEVMDFFDDSWKNGKRIRIEEINEIDFDQLVYFQFIHSPSEIKRLACRKITWIPMLDAEVERNYFEWLKYILLDIRIISFSKTLYDKVEKIGSNCYYFQYFPDPGLSDSCKSDENIVFFWQRSNKINWRLVKKILGGNKIDKIYFKNDPDPGQKALLPDKIDIERFNIEILNGWLPREKYLDYLSSCNIFIAPREYEGIGMSFLEAMKQGSCVIAPDNPTMNEYITDGISGYLFNRKNPASIDLNNHKTIGEKAREYMLTGYRRWSDSKIKILEIFQSPPAVEKISNIFWLYTAIYFYDILIYPILLLKKIARKSALDLFRVFVK